MLTYAILGRLNVKYNILKYFSMIQPNLLDQSSSQTRLKFIEGNASLFYIVKHTRHVYCYIS